MKKIKYIYIALATSIFIGACKQEPIKPVSPETPIATTPSKGNADFAKFVAIGNSLTAGYQAGALFDEGQANSLPKILATQFAIVGGGAFNQPDIGSVNGFSSEPAPGFYLGRLILYDPDGPTGPRGAAPYPAGFPGSAAPTCPSVGSATPALKAPYNTANKPGQFDVSKIAALNNFAVPGILLGQALIPDTGNPASPYFNGLWARFASAPGVKSIMQDALAANGTFFLFDLGNNDVLGYASTGGSGAVPLTSTASFQSSYTSAMAALLTGTTSKGVIANIPDVTTIPFFRTVLWNAIAFKSTDASTIAAVNAGYVAYNSGIQNPNFGLSADEISKRTIPQFVVGNNPIVITDKTLTNLTSFGVPSIRPATSADLITLSAGGILGTCVNNDATKIIGITVGLDDKYVLMGTPINGNTTSTEVAQVQTRTSELNSIIKAAADNSGGRIALADVNAAFTALVLAKADKYNGVTITPSFAPPTGAFSEDGVHPNSRGYAFMANVFLAAINKTFAANVPLADLSKFKGTGLPVNP